MFCNFFFIKEIQLPSAQIDCGSGRVSQPWPPATSTCDTPKQGNKTAFSQPENGVFHIRKRRFSLQKTAFYNQKTAFFTSENGVLQSENSVFLTIPWRSLFSVSFQSAIVLLITYFVMSCSLTEDFLAEMTILYVIIAN